MVNDEQLFACTASQAAVDSPSDSACPHGVRLRDYTDRITPLGYVIRSAVLVTVNASPQARRAAVRYGTRRCYQPLEGRTVDHACIDTVPHIHNLHTHADRAFPFCLGASQILAEAMLVLRVAHPQSGSESRVHQVPLGRFYSVRVMVVGGGCGGCGGGWPH